MLCVATVTAEGCGNDSQSPNLKDVSVNVSVLGTPKFTVGQAIDGYPLANCIVTLTAQVATPGSIAWGSATFYWYTGLDRTKLQDSAVASPSDVQASWDMAAFDSTGLGEGGWAVSDGLPFDLEIAFQYLIGSSRDIHTVRSPRMTCGPAVPQGSVAPPSISQLAFVQPRAQWQPSDTMWTQFQSSSASGVWLTYAAFSGAFAADSVYSDALQPSAQHVVHARIPSTATLGYPAIATVFAVDPFGQEVQQSIETSPLVDITPPTLQLYMYPPPYFGMTTNLGGTYFAGDSIYYLAGIADNNAVNAFVWHASPGAYMDSLPASAVGAPFSRLPVHAEWGDSVQFRFYDIDASGNVSDTIKTAPHAFTVYQTLNRPMVTGAMTADVTAALVDTARSAVYALEANQLRVGVFSATTLQQTATVPLPGYPISFDITSGGDSLVVALRWELVVIDLRDLSAAPTIIPLADVDTSAGVVAGQMRIAANDRAFVVRGSPTNPQPSPLEVDLATGAERIRSDAGSTSGISRSLDQKVLTFAGSGCVERYDSATDTFGPCTTTTPSGGAPSVDRTGQHFAIQRTAFDASFAPIGTVRTPWDLGNPPTTISGDGAYIYYYNAPIGLVRARVSDGAIMDRTRVPQFSSTGFFMSLSPDGSTMLLGWDDGTQGGTSHLATIDLRDSDAQPLLIAHAPAPPPISAQRSRMASSSSARVTQTRPWRARPAAPRPWRGDSRR